MKRLLILAIMGAMLLSCALADPADYVGTWVSVREQLGAVVYQIYILQEDGTLLHGQATFRAGEASDVLNDAGTWEELEPGKIRVIRGGLGTNLYLQEDGHLAESFGLLDLRPCFDREAAFTPVQVPQGRYYAGEDFPAGRYTITVDEGTGLSAVWVYSSREDQFGQGYVLGSYGDGMTVNVDLQEGSVLEIQYDDVTMSPYVSPFGR